MNQSEIEQMLIDIVCQLQETSGRVEIAVNLDTRPILDMPGFDSLNGVEATIEALDRLNLNLDFDNVFVDAEKTLTIQQAAARLLGCVPKQPVKHD